MTEIKCRYCKPRCTHYEPEYQENIEYYSPEYWACNSSFNCAGYTSHINEDAYPKCEFCEIRYVEFSKYVKQYTFVHHEGLEIGKEYIAVDMIQYLEIDSRVIINEEADT